MFPRVLPPVGVDIANEGTCVSIKLNSIKNEISILTTYLIKDFLYFFAHRCFKKKSEDGLWKLSLHFMNGEQNLDELSIVHHFSFRLKWNYWNFCVIQLKLYSCRQYAKICFWFSFHRLVKFFRKSQKYPRSKFHQCPCKKAHNSFHLNTIVESLYVADIDFSFCCKVRDRSIR